MYIIDTGSLADQLKKNAVPERDRMLYLLAIQLLGGLSLYVSLYTVVIADIYFFYEVFLYLAITVVGIIRAYKLNGGDSGERIIEKFVCLSWPISIKVVISVWLITYGWFALSSLLWEPGRYEEWGAQAIFVAGELFFFWRMWVHITRTVT